MKYEIKIEGLKGVVHDQRPLPKDEELSKLGLDTGKRLKEKEKTWPMYRREIHDATYKNGRGYYLPSVWFSAALVEGGKEVPKGARGSYSKTISRKGLFLEDEIPFEFKKEKNNGFDFAFFKCWTKTGNLRIRALFKNWKATVQYQTGEDLPEQIVKRCWQEAGCVGVGASRRYGYGKFKVVSFKKIK